VPRLRQTEDAPAACYLARYRAKMERLQAETQAEFGWSALAPETVSMLAVLMASLPMLALLLPTIPADPKVWQVLVAEVAVWAGAFRLQRPRFEAYQAQLARRAARLAAAEGRVPTPGSRLAAPLSAAGPGRRRETARP
jgi:hypothetical protein